EDFDQRGRKGGHHGGNDRFKDFAQDAAVEAIGRGVEGAINYGISNQRGGEYDVIFEDDYNQRGIGNGIGKIGGNIGSDVLGDLFNSWLQGAFNGNQRGGHRGGSGRGKDFIQDAAVEAIGAGVESAINNAIYNQRGGRRGRQGRRTMGPGIHPIKNVDWADVIDVPIGPLY
ncbi:hypothetical protein FBU59_007220, partial [Linderina macrospora]